MEHAPTFTLKNTQGEDVTLPEQGIVVLYFYPKAGTSGCTLEAKTFTALYPDFIEAGAFVFGISPDDVDDICSFAEKHGFSHNLLSDPGGRVAKQYGTWRKHHLFGLGTKRKTFLIQDGTIVKEYDHKPGKTEEQVLEDVGKIS